MINNRFFPGFRYFENNTPSTEEPFWLVNNPDARIAIAANAVFTENVRVTEQTLQAFDELFGFKEVRAKWIDLDSDGDLDLITDYGAFDTLYFYTTLPSLHFVENIAKLYQLLGCQSFKDWQSWL